MNIEAIEIHAEGIDRPYHVMGEVTAKITNVGMAAWWSPTIEEVNLKLREKASGMGANAIINVTYDRGLIIKSLAAKGVAVFIESDEKDCPFCAERIKSKAVKCKHCGAELPKEANESPKKLNPKVNPKLAIKNMFPLLVCKKCKADNHSANNFCENCGDKLDRK